MKGEEFFTSINEDAELLLFIRDHDGDVIMKDIDIISNHQTKMLKLDQMEDEGLIDKVVRCEPRKTTHAVITTKGMNVASMISTAIMFYADGRPICELALGKKYAESILRLLRAPKELTQADIIKSINNYRAVKKALEALEKDRLVTITPSESGYKTSYIRLTATGEKVAEIMEQVHRAIKG